MEPGGADVELQASAGSSAQPAKSHQGDIMTVRRMDNVGIVVEDIDADIEFFTELGLELEGACPN
jgi:hypothetical protein